MCESVVLEYEHDPILPCSDSTTQTDGFENNAISVHTSSKSSKSNNISAQTTLWDFDQATSISSINEFESKGGHGMMQMQSIQEEKPYIDTKSSSKEITGTLLFFFFSFLFFYFWPKKAVFLFN